MPRFARVVVPNCPHHITQRGNERRPVFFTDADREVYLGLLKQYAELYPTDVLAWCLMTNHVHLVASPRTANALGKLLREVQMRYSQYRHAIDRSNGHLWQSRYYSCPVEPGRLAAVVRYVELNPVRAGMVREAEQYGWSSARVHLGREEDFRGLLALEEWKRTWRAEEWRAVLEQGADDAATIREATYGGRPLGSEGFVTRLEQCVGRRLARGSPGRPRKKENLAFGAMQGGGEI